MPHIDLTIVNSNAFFGEAITGDIVARTGDVPVVSQHTMHGMDVSAGSCESTRPTNEPFRRPRPRQFAQTMRRVLAEYC